jgi:hypothetical protein
MERVHAALKALGINEEWWKHGGGPRGPFIGLDLKYRSSGTCNLATALYPEAEALPLIAKLLDHPDVLVAISDVSLNDNYIEIAVYPAQPQEHLKAYRDTPCPCCGVTPKQYYDAELAPVRAVEDANVHLVQNNKCGLCLPNKPCNFENCPNDRCRHGVVIPDCFTCYPDPLS